MDYRVIKRTGEQVSTVGIGGTCLHTLTDDQGIKIINQALDQGINMIDLTVESPNVFPMVRKALKGRREKVLLGLHLGLTFQDDCQYKRTRDISIVKPGFERQLKDLGTDYADIAYFHYVDDQDDLQNIFSSGAFDLALRLKGQGRIRKLAFSSHKTDICRKFLETGEIDLFMFSVNPAYDLDPIKHNPMNEDWSSFNRLEVAQDRADLYWQAERQMVPITVMKPFSAGRLLDARTSPFGQALTVPQCLQYCLDRPGVVSCLVGVSSEADLQGLLRYYQSSPEERDYSAISKLTLAEMRGQCVYCNHCLPCPSQIDIASVHKFLDLAIVGDETARHHYLSLANKAGDCVECGSCEDNCPFQVSIRKKMKQALDLFGQ